MSDSKPTCATCLFWAKEAPLCYSCKGTGKQKSYGVEQNLTDCPTCSGIGDSKHRGCHHSSHSDEFTCDSEYFCDKHPDIDPYLAKARKQTAAIENCANYLQVIAERISR